MKPSAATLAAILLLGGGCSSLPQPIDPKVSELLDQEFCSQIQPDLRSTQLEISDEFFFDAFVHADGYVNPLTGTVHIRTSVLRNASSSKDHAQMLRLYVVHEYLHFLWFEGQVDGSAFMADYQCLRADLSFQPVVQSVEQELSHKGFINMFFFGSSETYSKVGEKIALGTRLPYYITRHYQGILRDADPNGQFPFPLQATVAQRSN